MWTIEISKSADKTLKRAPIEIKNSFDAWKNIVEMNGVKGVSLIKGYRDHALRGEWEGARSSSLNSQWRIIYYVDNEEVKIMVLEVTPHDYRRKL